MKTNDVCLFACCLIVSSSTFAAELGLNVILTSDLGGVSGTAQASLPPQWESGFNPPGGSMSVSQKNYNGGFAALGIGLEPTVRIRGKKGEWEIGLPVIYRGTIYSGGDTGGINENLLMSLTVNWWDPVTLQTEYNKKDLPWIGISLRYDQWRVVYSVTPYDHVVKNYYGIDHYGARNESAVKKQYSLGSGISHRFDLAYRIRDTRITIGPFVEAAGNAAVWAGLSLTYNPRILGR